MPDNIVPIPLKTTGFIIAVSVVGGTIIKYISAQMIRRIICAVSQIKVLSVFEKRSDFLLTGKVNVKYPSSV